MSVKDALLGYMKANYIEEKELFERLNIRLEKLENQEIELTGDEFCRICQYLNVDPWLFYKKK